MTFDSTSTGLDPHELISTGGVEARANAAVQAVEARLGDKLDPGTAENIREDVRRIWGRGTPGAE